MSPPPQYDYSPPSGRHPVSPSELSSNWGVTAESSSGRLSAAQASSSLPMPTTIEELELQYLESEARRIQQRREEIMRTRESKVGEGSGLCR